MAFVWLSWTPPATVSLRFLGLAPMLVRNRGVHMPRRRSKRSTGEDCWLSVEEIADHLGINRDTVYKWIERKRMPAHKVGRLWKFKKDEIDTWVRTGQAGANPAAPTP